MSDFALRLISVDIAFRIGDVDQVALAIVRVSEGISSRIGDPGDTTYGIALKRDAAAIGMGDASRSDYEAIVVGNLPVESLPARD